MSAPDLEPIKARLAAVTPGQYTVRHRSHGSEVVADTGLSIAWVGNNGTYSTTGSHTRDEAGSYADADLIANAPADLAALVAEVERLRDCICAALDNLEGGPEALATAEGALRRALANQ